MKELILGVIALIFATVYNIIVFVLNLECADDKFVDAAMFLMALNVTKDALVLAAILYNIFFKMIRRRGKDGRTSKSPISLWIWHRADRSH